MTLHWPASLCALQEPVGAPFRFVQMPLPESGKIEQRAKLSVEQVLLPGKPTEQKWRCGSWVRITEQIGAEAAITLRALQKSAAPPGFWAVQAGLPPTESKVEQ